MIVRTFRLSEELYERLRERAYRDRVPMNALIVEGLELRLAPQEVISLDDDGSGSPGRTPGE